MRPCISALIITLTLIAAGKAFGASAPCPVSHEQLASALKANVKASGGPSNGGFDNNMWATVVGRDGIVCAVAFSGAKWDDQWPGSRVISAQKANTANGFSLKKKSLSTANMYAGSQPGGFLFGIQDSNPVSPDAAYAGDAAAFGSESDPMVGNRIGGVNVFAGGLALYTDSDVVGGLGLSGDTSCADHNVAWRVRHSLQLDKVPAGVSSHNNDAIIFDLGLTGGSASGYGHPKCAAHEVDVAIDIGAGEGGGLLTK